MIIFPNGPVSFKKVGFRDVYWCWLLNEPTILTYPDGLAQCSACGNYLEEPFDDGGVTHSFMYHILKPKMVKTNE